MLGVILKELTFCIQGPVAFNSKGTNLTEKLIQSIRLFFPNSQIILSTWEHENLNFVDGIRVVQSRDPGSGVRYRHGLNNNINRQIISTNAGLNLVKTKYVVKVRSDLLIEGSSLGKIILKLPDTIENDFSIFKKYVIVLDRLTFSSRKKENPALHVTDMLQAGLTSDITKMWNLPLMSFEQERFYENASIEISKQVRNHIPEFRAEQYFWNELIFKEFGVRLPNTLSRAINAEIEIEDLFNLNIIPFRFPTLGISIQKESYASWSRKDSWVSSIYAHTFFDWKQFAREQRIPLKLPLRNLFWEYRGALYGYIYNKGFNFPPGSKLHRTR